jgi:hypothetical protein
VAARSGLGTIGMRATLSQIVFRRSDHTSVPAVYGDVIERAEPDGSLKVQNRGFESGRQTCLKEARLVALAVDVVLIVLRCEVRCH